MQDIISSQTLEDLEKLKDGNDSLPEVVIVVTINLILVRIIMLSLIDNL